jgi:hypothetical protein
MLDMKGAIVAQIVEAGARQVRNRRPELPCKAMATAHARGHASDAA